MAPDPVLLSTLAAILAASYLAPRIFKAYVARSKLKHIPTIGPSGLLKSYYWAYYKLVSNGREMIQEGYDKYYGTAFRVPTMSKWMIIVSSPQMVDDIRKADDDQVSFREAVSDTIQFDYTVGPEIHHDPYHVAVVRTPLTRNLGVRFPEVQDEITTAFGDFIPVMDEWIKVSTWRTIMQIVCRTSNRLFVGLPLCRDRDYRALNIQFTIDVINSGRIINRFPNLFKPIAGRLFTKAPGSIRRAMKHLRPIIEDRLAKEAQYGPDWPEKPNDLISWLLEYAQGHQRTLRDLTIRVLQVNFGAIHTTTNAFTHTLYDLAAYPSHVPELREEVESVIKEEGLNKASLGKMRKLDSFLKESQRLRGNSALGMGRKILQDFTFSDGSIIPAGNTVFVASYAMHHDGALYDNAEQFDGFRFARMRESEGESTKHQMVSLSQDFVAFGNGRHACPGRFFAVNELKTMLVHVLLTYDVKLENEGVRPTDRWSSFNFAPDPTAVVMFRKRCS